MKNQPFFNSLLAKNCLIFYALADLLPSVFGKHFAPFSPEVFSKLQMKHLFTGQTKFRLPPAAVYFFLVANFFSFKLGA